MEALVLLGAAGALAVEDDESLDVGLDDEGVESLDEDSDLAVVLELDADDLPRLSVL